MTELVTVPAQGAFPLETASRETFHPLPEAIHPPDPIQRREIPPIEKAEPIIGQDQFKKKEVPRFHRQRFKDYFSRLKRPEIQRAEDPVIDFTDKPEPVIDFTSRLKDKKAVGDLVGEKEIPEERRNQLMLSGMLALAENPVVDGEGGVYDQAYLIEDPDERELFLEGAAEEIVRINTMPKDARGGRIMNELDRAGLRDVAYKRVKEEYPLWENKKNGLVNFPTQKTS